MKYRLISLCLILFTIQSLGSAKVSVEIVNKTHEITLQKHVFFPNETVLIEANFKPKKAELITPISKQKLKFKRIDDKFVAKYSLKKEVVLGKYTVMADNLTANFTVDSYAIDASYKNFTIVGYVKSYYTAPQNISYDIYSVNKIVSGDAEVKNGSFTIPISKLNLLPGNYTAVLTCGNAEKTLKFEIKELRVKIISKDEYNIGEEMSVKILTFLGNKQVDAQMNVTVNGKSVNLTKVNKTYYFNSTALKDVRIEVEARFNGFKCVDEKFVEVKKELTVNARAIVKDRNVSVVGNVSLNDNPTNATLRYSLNGVINEVAVNGEFAINFTDLLPSDYTLNLTAVKTIKNLTLTAFEQLSFTITFANETNKTKTNETIETNETIKLKDVYFPGETVKIKLASPKNVVVIDPQGVKHALNTTETKMGYVAEFPLLKGIILGEYTVVVDGFQTGFFVDSYTIDARYTNGVVEGNVSSYFTKPKYVEFLLSNESVGIKGRIGTTNGKFTIPVNLTGNCSAVLICGNAKATLNFSIISKKVWVEPLHFLNEKVVIRTNFKPKNAFLLIENRTKVIEFGDNQTYEFTAKKVGFYKVVVDDLTANFTVDDYSINAFVSDSMLFGNVSWYFVKPKYVEYTLLPLNITGKAEIVNDSFSFNVENATAVIVRCGNAELKLDTLNKTVNVGKLYFVNETARFEANFMPKVAYLLFDNETLTLNFSLVNENYVASFVPTKVGKYKIVIDNLSYEFFVDDYKLNASLGGYRIKGNVSWHYIMPEFFEYIILPSNVSGKVALENGVFELNILKNTSKVILKCGNSRVEIRVPTKKFSDRRTLNLSLYGKTFEIDVGIDKGRFEGLKVKGENVTLKISGIKVGAAVNVTVDLPFEIPEGMHVYYWKEVNGKIIPVNYTISNGNRITFTLKDGVLDEDGKANGVIVDPLKFYVPKFKVERELNGSYGVLHVYDLNATRLYDVKVEVDKGNLTYLAFVDSANLPSKPAEFPYQLVKFRVEDLKKGDNVSVRITYPSLTPTDNGVKYYKFNAKNLSWGEFYTPYENSTVILNLKDGGFGDGDGKVNGVVEDDGGVGWAGYSGEDAAAICRDGKTNEVHTYWVYVPSGDEFNVSFYDGDDFWFDLYYPDGTYYGTFNASSNEAWDNFTINTNNFGWWKLEIQDDGWGWDNGNYYGLKVTGADEINIRVNESWSVNGETFYGTPDSIMLDVDDPEISNTMEFWVYTTGNFKIAVYDPDNYLSVSVSNENGSSLWSGYFSGNNIWTTQEIQVGEGWYKILLTQRQNYDDYSTGGNHMRFAVNLSDGLYFKPMNVPITGKVLEDIYPLGSNGGEDIGVANAIVAVFEDDGNGVLDANDRLIEANQTNSSGYYTLKVVKDFSKTYFVAVNSKTIGDVQFNDGYNSSYIWAEQTYQVEWDGSAWTFVKKFGGRDAEKSDKFGVVFYDDFEEWEGWQDYGSGTVYQSSDYSYLGIYSLKKDDNNDPNGGYKPLPYNVSRDAVLEGWVYRPSPWGGGPIDRIGLEDENFNGYSIKINHRRNYIAIDKRTNGNPTEVSKVSWNPPENEWYHFKFYIFSNGTLRLETYYLNGTLGAAVSATDTSYSTFDRVVVHGGYVYYVDNLVVNLLNPNYEHYVKVNLSNYNEQSLDFGFNFSVIVNTKDSDDDEANQMYCQGCLRQFITNANAIAGKQRSYFVMMVSPNSNDANGRWWTITVNSSLGTLPAINDSTELNGTVLYENMSIRDENPGYVCYDYSTKSLKSYDTQVEIQVGVGLDAIPFSGDESKMRAVMKPEIEIYSNMLGSVLNVTANGSTISHLSIFGAKTDYSGDYWNYGFGIKVGVADDVKGSNTIIKDAFVGLRANASDPESSGLNRNEYVGIIVYSNNTTILDSIAAYNGATGIEYWGRGVKSGTATSVQTFRNGLINEVSDGLAIEGWIGGTYESRASNVTFSKCLASKNAGYGIDSWFGKEQLIITNCTIEFNGIGNESGIVSELGGIRTLANNSLIAYNLIRNNMGSGVVVGRMANYSTYGIEITRNSIVNNSWVGIDINPALNYGESYNGNNVTLNDGLLNSSQPNYGLDYPVITHAYLNGSNLYVEGFIGKEDVGASPNFSNAQVEVYLVKNSTGGDNLIGNNVSSNGTTLDKHYGEGWIYLGSLTSDTDGRFRGNIDASGVDYKSAITATTTLNGNTSEFGPNYLLRMYRNVTAAIEIYWVNGYYNATISVTAHNKTQWNVKTYWIKPDDVVINSMSGDYIANGSNGNLYWWTFDEIQAESVRHIYINFTANSIIDACIIGIDPE